MIENRTQAGNSRRARPILVAALVALGLVASGCGGGSGGTGTTMKSGGESLLGQHKDNPSSKDGALRQAPNAVRAADHSPSHHKDNPTASRDAQANDSGGTVGEHKENPTVGEHKENPTVGEHKDNPTSTGRSN
jgi:hypothetical protein